MLNSNFIVTLFAIFAIIFSLFQNEIKEGFTTNANMLPEQDNRGVAKYPNFAAWGGVAQQIGVPGTITGRGKGANFQAVDVPNYKLGYDMSMAFPRGVDTNRNIQIAPPPRFIVTEPKLNHYKPIDMDKYAVSDKPIQHASEVVKSNFGQIQRDSRADVKEGFSDTSYESASVPLPKDMCNVNLLGTEAQPVIYDRVMYSNIRSRTRGQGDYIRGDLMITPDNYKPGGGGHPQWFQVSAKPNRDLNPGCMEHLYGRNEEISLGFAQADVDVASFGL